jgi:hypothetical protein
MMETKGGERSKEQRNKGNKGTMQGRESKGMNDL